jgi:hypothetical protein
MYAKVHVKWRDSSNVNLGWAHPADLPEWPMEVETVGFLVFTSEEHDTYGVTVAVSDNGMVENLLIIPIENVTSFRVLEKGEDGGSD